MTPTTLPHNHSHTSPALRANMPSETSAKIISDLFKIMGDETRIRIFWWLCHSEECVTNISSLVNMSSPAVAHHLKTLKKAGLIISRRKGKEVHYTAADTARSQILHNMIEQTMEITCPIEERFNESHKYDSQIQIIHDIHTHLTSDLMKRPTIEDLSHRFHINTTTLKSTFKLVYGKPIASYMKEYRIKRAMEFLLETDMSVSKIALKVGYENSSKFSNVFKEITGILPKDFRKNKKSTD